MSTIADQLILEQIPGSIAWKDNKLKYRGANKNLLVSMNLQHIEELLGLDDTDLALNSPKMNAIFYQQDLLALKGRTVEMIHQLESKQDKQTYFLKKAPLRDEQGKIIGVIYHCMPWSQNELFMLLKNLDKKFQQNVPDYYTFDIHHNPAALSARELECLFLQLRGKSVKQIAVILGLSCRTIESYIDNIKAKFGCQNKAELLVAAMTQGYQYHVPKGLLKLIPDVFQ